MRTPTPILTSTTHLATAAEAICDQFDLGRAKKSRVLNILAGAIAGPKHNWGYLTGFDGTVVSPTPKGAPALTQPATRVLDGRAAMEALSFADDLERGIAADIWYDAAAHNDPDNLEIIEKTQTGMERVARLLRQLAGQEALPQQNPDPAEPPTWSSTHSHWEEHEDFPARDWRYEVENNETRLSYAEWVDGKIELALYDQEDDRADDAETFAETPEAQHYAISMKSEFLAIAGPALRKRADELALQNGGYSWVLWFPADPTDALMFVGDSEASLRAQFADAMQAN